MTHRTGKNLNQTANKQIPRSANIMANSPQLQQTHEVEDEERPEITYVTISQRIQDTYAQYYAYGMNKLKGRPRYKINSNMGT